MKILFIGGTGIISTACMRLAQERGMQVTLLNRGRRAVEIPAGVETITADIGQPEQVAAVLGGRTFDVVADFIAFTPAHVQRDMQLFRGKTGQYVFISSASAYQKPPASYIITEATPLVNPYWGYSRDKAACEALLLEEFGRSGFPATIIRPSLTYGDTLIPLAINSWGQSWTVVDRMLRGKKVIVHGDGTALWVTTHNTDFAKGFVGLLGNAKALGEAFHITSDEVLSWNDFYRIVGEVAGAEAKFAHIPTDTLMAFDPGLEGGLLGDKAWCTVFDNSKIKRFVPGFKAEVSFRQGMERTIARFRAEPALQAVDAQFNEWCDRLIAAYERALPAK
jgi:nucleoside-diphosphate-sugar epimerase